MMGMNSSDELMISEECSLVYYSVKHAYIHIYNYQMC